jgi:hypothetical protein
MADVAYHEYGHGITDQIYPSDPRTSLHEGNSDIAANLLTRESIIGLGFFLNNCTSGIRDSDNNMQYPEDWTNSHTGGQIIAGFVWDSWQTLLTLLPQGEADSVASHGWHFSRILGLPQLEEDQVLFTFVADDDDGDLDNGTPHHGAWCVGAMNHGFDCPTILSPVTIVHTPVTVHTNENDPIEIAANITSTEAAINESALRVWYGIDGGSLISVGMASTGGNDYSGFIPAQAAGAFVEYYIYAEDDLTNSATDPLNAPFVLHGLYVGDFSTLLSHDFEADQGWTVGDVGDDATTGVWERGDPQGTVASGSQVQPEDDHTPNPGVNCYATQLAAGTSAGTYDVDGGKTTLFSPVIDLSGESVALATYWRWYTNNLGASPGSDIWEVQVNDGNGWVYLENTTSSANSWKQHIFRLNDYIDLTDQVQFRFIASDEGDGSLVEAAVDDFEILGISTPDISPSLSTIDANDDLMLSPAGDGDSVLTITVTVRDGTGTPLQGIPAGAVVVDAAGLSSLGGDITFCNGTPNAAQFVSTAPTDVNGQTVITVTNVGGCGSITLTAEVQGVPLVDNAVANVRSPDMNGDGIVQFLDSILFAQQLGVSFGYCANLNGDPADLVDFSDTIKFLPHLAATTQCP